MKKLLIVVAVAAQFAVLAWMAVEREWVVRNGRTVYLRTAPVDPTDPMRGEYVRLDYEIANVPKSLCRDGVATWFESNEVIYSAKQRDRRVYAEIRQDAEGISEIISLTDRWPSEGFYLRGRANATHMSTVAVRFGVEALFMQQGKAKALEDEMRSGKAGVPLNMEIKVGSGGLAVLNGYRWEPLGITLELDRVPAATRAAEGIRNVRPGLRGLTIELKNHGSTPQAIVTGRAENCFRLQPAVGRWRSNDEAGWLWVGEKQPVRKIAGDEITLLQPGESHRVHVDLTKPEWFVQKVTGKDTIGSPVALESLVEDWSASFRFEYRPPDAENARGLPHAEFFRHTGLRSRAFSAAGGVD